MLPGCCGCACAAHVWREACHVCSTASIVSSPSHSLPPQLCPTQFFEGFAIGSAVVDSGLGLWKSVMAGAIYSITTPLGIAVGEPQRWAAGSWGPYAGRQVPWGRIVHTHVMSAQRLVPERPDTKSMHPWLAAHPSSPPGIAVRESFNQNAQTTLLVEGIFDAISTGEKMRSFALRALARG